MENKPFKFTQKDRNRLLDSWKQKAARVIAREYIKQVERIVHNTTIDPAFPPEDRTPQQERDDDKRIHNLSVHLRGALINQSARSKRALAGHLHDIARSQGYGADSDIILERLVGYLVMLEFAMKSRLERKTPRTARKDDSTGYLLMVSLLAIYQRHFKKNPKTGNGSNFREFLKTLSSIINIPLGSDLLQRAFNNFKI